MTGIARQFPPKLESLVAIQPLTTLKRPLTPPVKRRNSEQNANGDYFKAR